MSFVVFIVEEEKMLKKLSNYCIYLFFLITFIIYPLIFKNGYYDIGIVKYNFFVIFSAGAMFIMIPTLVFGESVVFTKMDKLVLLYLGSNIISFLLSDYKYSAWYGAEGWYLGLFSQILFVCIYF